MPRRKLLQPRVAGPNGDRVKPLLRTNDLDGGAVSTHPAHEALIKMIQLNGAIASVALSHPDGHDCDVCRASHGDGEALERIMVSMEETREH